MARIIGSPLTYEELQFVANSGYRKHDKKNWVNVDFRAMGEELEKSEKDDINTDVVWFLKDENK